MKVLCGDIETDGLLSVVTKFHCAVFTNPDTDESYVFTDIHALERFLSDNADYYLAMHNGICFDKPALQKLGISVPNKVIDTLALSYYLHLDRKKHGLESWGEEAGQPKPPVDDWSDQPIEVYVHRCTCDVKIQTYIWKKFYARLLDIYGNEQAVLKLIGYLNLKMEQQRIQENNPINFDLESASKLLSELEEIQAAKKAELESVMPKVARYKELNKPKVLYKLNGEKSALHIKWLTMLSELGYPDDVINTMESVSVLAAEENPNSSSHKQVKDWLFSLGWVPETYKTVKDEKDAEELAKERALAKINKKRGIRSGGWVKPYIERQIPQILTEDKEVCQSILKLAKRCPEVGALADLGVVQHRIGMLKGFIETSNRQGGVLIAGMSGFTNTLRLKHRQLVNLPSSRKKWGTEIRALLMAGDGYCLLGSDLSSLEDRLKHSFQWPLDPDYVKTQMASDYDGHILNALSAGLITQADVDWFKWAKAQDDLPEQHKARYKMISEYRHQGKATSYSCQYGAGAETVANAAGVDLDVGKLLHEAYWKLNWSIKVIAENTTVKKDSEGQSWQWNPISEIWYHLKTEKDRFSTLIQGTGSFIEDEWINEMNNLCLEKYGREIPLCAQFHDEVVLRVKDGSAAKATVSALVVGSLANVNKRLSDKMNREMACEVSFGYNYSEIH